MSNRPNPKQVRALELLRKDPELSAPQIAERVGVGKSQISRWLQEAGLKAAEPWDRIAFISRGRRK